VVNDMALATQDWERLCSSCGVEFTHIGKYDRIQSWQDFEILASTDILRFIVMYRDVGGEFIASAFFPGATVRERAILIDPSYFGSGGYPGRGVLRHELGHVLGYRHEHTRGVMGCYFENEQWSPLTTYDPSSVMHYLCGGGGTSTLDFTNVDKNGHRALYGGN
jgi:hypothetical protein